MRNFDIEKGYEGVRKRSLDMTLLPWRLGPKSPLDDFYAEHGYMPALRPGEKETYKQVHPFEKRQPVPVTLENSFDDWNIAQIARELKKPEDQTLFLKRAANYKNVFRVDKSMMWPKDADGKWIEPLDPKFDGGMGGRDYYDENNGYTYTWDVQHDFGGLIDLMGGAAKAEANLDQLFREPLGRSKYEFQAKFPDSTSMIGQFSMGNEPSMVIPYVYNRMGAPWKTQKRIRMLLETFFPNTLHGIPGDEDGGGMSAFVVFSMLGFYPVTPGIPVYDIGSPVFTRATIHLNNGKDFSITAPDSSRDNKYVQSIRLNGQPLNQVWFRHADIAQGGTLELIMGNTPNTKLGSDPSTFPPDSMNVNPEQFAGKPKPRRRSRELKFWGLFELVVGVLFAVESSLGMMQTINVAKEGWWGPVTLGAAVLLAIAGLAQLLPKIHPAVFVVVAAVIPIGISIPAGELSAKMGIFAVLLAFFAWTMQSLSRVPGRTDVGTLFCGLVLSIALLNTTVALFRFYWNDPSFWPLHKIFQFMSPIALPWTLVLILLIHSARECLQPEPGPSDTGFSRSELSE